LELDKNILVVAGEKSGEEHLLSFFLGLKKKLINYKFWGVGGADLKKNDVELVYNLSDFSSMGITEVIKKVPFYFKALNKLEEMALERKTEAAILVDFQDFNMRLAKRLTKVGVKVFYYVAPQAWIWRPNRVKNLIQNTNHLFCILPFEKEWFRSRGVRSISSVPHPVWSKFSDEKLELKIENEKDEILLLPGSRNSEVRTILPTFIKSLEDLPAEYKVSIVKTPSVSTEIYKKFEGKFSKVYKSTELYEALSKAKIALAASGTVTLSSVLMQVPTIVGYRLTPGNELFFRVFVNYRGHVSLANLIAGEEIFPEYLQDRFSNFYIRKKLFEWLNDENEYQSVVNKAKIVQERFEVECEDVVDVIWKKLC
tara:strand:- start:150 stop:1256 length:1107 start_codon:yes stop_codon:yes gene_type:complete